MRPRLTKKQKVVCDLISQGLNCKEIATQLGISPRTVEDHRQQVFKRLGVRNAVLLTRKVLLEGNPV